MRIGRHCRRGFTIVELIAVIAVTAVLAVVAMPALQGGLSMRSAAWRDQVLAALRTAHLTAIGHRRLVCASVAAGSVVLTMATANPAVACAAAVPGPDGQAAWAHEPTGIATALSPAGTLYFQPSGRITSDGAGATAYNGTLAVMGEGAIGIVGETGHVE